MNKRRQLSVNALLQVEMTSLLVDEVSKWSPYQMKGLDRFRYQRP
jgi:hypothetical protein